jgi:hypothetical protein
MDRAAFILSIGKKYPEKERQERDRKASGLPCQQGDKREPEQADIEKYYAQYLDFGGHMLCDYGPLLAVTRQQHTVGQPSADGPAVG